MRTFAPVSCLVLLAASAAASLTGCNDILGIREPSTAVLDAAGDAGPAAEPAAPLREDPDAHADEDHDQDAGR